jgi:hypothetical protein
MKAFPPISASPDFERLTGLDAPQLVAGVVDELRAHFGGEPPAGLAAELLGRLRAGFALHGSWRARVLRAPAPDYLRIFLRRWAAELLFRNRRDWYEALPRGYRTGGSLSSSHPQPLTDPINPRNESEAAVTVSRDADKTGW